MLALANVGKRALFLVSDFTLQHLQKSILKRLQRNNSGDPALGALTMPNGDKYVGQFRDGKPNGRGVINLGPRAAGRGGAGFQNAKGETPLRAGRFRWQGDLGLREWRQTEAG